MNKMPRLAELYKPNKKAEGEQKFVKKHVVVKTDDRNGNDDKLFNASNVTAVDRHKEHGYNPGEDEKMYEAKMTPADMKQREKMVKGMKKNLSSFRSRYGKDAKAVMYATATKRAMEEEAEQVDEQELEEAGLVGNQHKIDANKNGKIDKHDFDLLKKKKKVEESRRKEKEKEEEDEEDDDYDDEDERRVMESLIDDMLQSLDEEEQKYVLDLIEQGEDDELLSIVESYVDHLEGEEE